jgi:alpha-beta hydrolase superfamily lysophospholipase
MRKIARHSFTMGRRAIGYGLFGIVITLLATAIHTLEKRPDLDVWHTVDLDEEFTRKSEVTDFAGYLALEDRLFKQLEEKVYQKTGPADSTSINRYQHGSRMDPTAMKPDWNRTFELTSKDPQTGILLLHGMSDSPYSLRALGESFHASGATVVGLRVPGHGTAPSGLVEVSWLDMAAAVRIAVKHVRESVGDRPVQLVGYSNGGALAVHYALETLEDPKLPKVDRLVLLSPEIGISPAASMAVWQGRLGHWLGLEKLAWTSINLEYDPYKYGSFAVNAGDQAYRITTVIDKQLSRMAKEQKLADFPPTLAFQSAIDATVSAPDLVSRLFDRLPVKGHELVLFDMNHGRSIQHVLAANAVKDLAERLKGATQDFTLTILSNRDSKNTTGHPHVLIHRRPAGQNQLETVNTEMAWPPGIFSLAHIALPFPPSDPVYGSGDNGKIITLGNLALRGEHGAIRISPGDMLRQRWNPFFPWLQNRAHDFCGLPVMSHDIPVAPRSESH